MGKWGVRVGERRIVNKTYWLPCCLVILESFSGINVIIAMYFVSKILMRLRLWHALQDLSQPKSEASPPDGVLAVPLLRHQVWKISFQFFFPLNLSW